MSVFVLDRNQRPLMPCSEKRARKLLDSGRARVHKLYPFCIRLVDRKQISSVLQPMRLALDPGSKTTDSALTRMEPQVEPSTGEIQAPVMHIAYLMELTHRGQQIKDALHGRAALRRGRRPAQPALAVKCTGRGSCCRTRVDASGFPRGYLTRSKRVFGFATGDMVRAEMPCGKNAGVHVGLVAVRATGHFNIQTSAGVIQGISHRHCKVIQGMDGYGYSIIHADSKPARKGRAMHDALSIQALGTGFLAQYQDE